MKRKSYFFRIIIAFCKFSVTGYSLRQLPPFDILGKGLEDSFVIVWKRGV